MPYRSDSRDDAERRLKEALDAHDESNKRVRATAASLRRLTARFERELAEADRDVAAAEAAWRDAMRHGLAQDGGQHSRVRAALRSAGVVAALEAAIRRKKPPAAPKEEKHAPERPNMPQHVRVKEAETRLAAARKRRARLSTQREPTLEAAKARMTEAVLAHDETTERLEGARARLDAES